MFNFKEMPIPPSASAAFSAYASFATTTMLVRSIATELIPQQLISFFSSIFLYIFGSASSQTKFIIEEQSSFIPNQIFQAAEIYLRTKITPSTDVLKINKTPNDKNITLSITNDQEIADRFDKIRLQWRLVSTKDESRENGEKRQFELKFPKKFRSRIVDFYLPYVLKRAEEIREEGKIVKIHSQERCQYGGGDESGSINLDHPATFDTLAMDPDLKQWIIEDLDRFVRRKDFYRKVGKAWKRGYLLYGPPGTGKSSLVAAMANYLKFDVYDLDLSSIYNNNELKRIMLSTTNRSILVIEDIDCSADIQNREMDEYGNSSKFTLSGMLNFIDGLWSSCGDEKIIIFTTNHKERLDSALLRPGRMDVHINMSYLSPQGFKVLATNYIGDEATKHHLYGEIEGLIGEMELSPAEIAEELMKSEDVNVVMKGIVEFLKGKREEERNKHSESNENKKNPEAEEESEKSEEETNERNVIESKKRKTNKKKKKKNK